MPYTRAFLNQAVSAVSFLSKGQRLKEGISLDPSNYQVASDYPSKPDVQRWLCAMLPSVPQSPSDDLDQDEVADAFE